MTKPGGGGRVGLGSSGRPREATDLELPTPPTEVPELGADLPGLLRSGQSGPGEVLLEAERVSVHAEQRGPVRAIRIDGRVVAERVRAPLGACANFVMGVGGLRREWLGPEGGVLETVALAGRLPLCAVQWAAAGRPPTVVAVDVPTGGDAHYRTEGGVLVVGRGSTVTAIATVPRRRVEAGRSEHGALEVRFLPPEPPEPPRSDAVAPGRTDASRPSSSTVTLLVAAGTPTEVRRALAAAAHLPAHVRLATAPETGLSIESDDGELDEAFAWARHRLAGVVRHLGRGVAGPQADTTRDPTAPVPPALWAGLAAACVGSTAQARVALDALSRAGAAGRAPAPVASSILAAQLARGTGDARDAVRTARLLAEALAEGGGEVLEGREAAVLPVALEAMAEVLEGAADPSLLDELRGAAAADPAPGDTAPAPLPASRAEADGSVALPMAGSRPVNAASWLTALLSGEPIPAPPGSPAPFGMPGALRAGGEGAWASWRTAVLAGLEGGPAGPGSWDPAWWDPDPTGPGARTAGLIFCVTGGLLGLRPDAAVGRIRIGPLLPSGLTRLVARGIEVGDASLDITYVRDRGRHVITLAPRSAAVPPTAILEPAVHGAVRRTLVDGADVELDSHVVGGRTVVPIQLPVDATRTVEIVTD